MIDFIFKSFAERVEFYKKYEDEPERLKSESDAWKEWCKTLRIKEAFNDWLFDYCFGDVIE